MSISSVHFNHNLFCSIDTEGTGLIPGTHEVIQLAVIPLSPDITPSKHYPIFELRIRPENLDAIDPDMKGLNRDLIVDTRLHGMEHWAAVDYFRSWFYDKLKLPVGKKITPLGCNFEAYDRPMLVEFFGGVASYEEFFRSDVRDVQRTALALNDFADWNSIRIPFPKVDLSYLCSCLNIENRNRHNALSDAVATAEVYRRMMDMANNYAPAPEATYIKVLRDIAVQYADYRVAMMKQDKVPLDYDNFRRAWEAGFGKIY